MESYETNPRILEALDFPLYASFKTAPSLGIPILTALTPDEHELHFADGNLEEIPYDQHFDLVAINCFTPQAKHAYVVASEFKKRGVLTVIGGIHASNMSEECKLYADAVCIGEAEQTWGEILTDAKNGKLKPFYRGDNSFNLDNYVMPDRRLYREKKGYDWKPLLIQSFRGCKYNCNYCAIPEAHGKCLKKRPVEHVMKEISMNMDLDGLFLAEDQFLLPDPEIEKYAFQFFSELKKMNYKKEIFFNSSALINQNTELLKLIKDSGVNSTYLVMGFDPISVKAVSHNMPEEAERNIKMIQDAGLEIFASVGVGLEADDTSVFERHIDFLARNNIKHVEFWILTPFPGTPMWHKYMKKDRMLIKDFDYYNGAHTVFQPKKMSVKELDDGFIWLWKEFFTRFPLAPEEAAKYYNLTDDFKMKHNIKK